MSNLRPAPLFLTPQVTRDMLGVGRARNMAEIEVVSLTDIGNRCSELRLSILRAIGALRSGKPSIDLLASQVGIGKAALHEHLASLRQCGCLEPVKLLALTAKGRAKISGGGGNRAEHRIYRCAPRWGVVGHDDTRRIH